jgi:hypothetical protein
VRLLSGRFFLPQLQSKTVTAVSFAPLAAKEKEQAYKSSISANYRLAGKQYKTHPKSLFEGKTGAFCFLV